MADFQIGQAFVKGRNTVIRAVALPGAARFYATRDANGVLTLPTLPSGSNYVTFQGATNSSFQVSDNNQEFRLLGDDGWTDSVITGSSVRASVTTYFQKDVDANATSLNLGTWGGTITGGTGYTSAGTYTNVPLTSTPSTGRAGATATITVAGGAVTAVTITNGGTGYQSGDVLTTASSNLGGAGSGFQISVSAARLSPGPIFLGGYDEGFALIEQARYNKELEIYFEFLKELGQANDGTANSSNWVYDTACINGVIMNYNESISADNLSQVSFDVVSRGRPVFGRLFNASRITIGSVQ